MLNFLYKVYNYVVFFLGNATLITLVVYWGVKIYQFFKMKSVTKEYAKKIHESRFLYDIGSKMTEEEKKAMEENESATTKITLNFDDVSVKKETK